jgi:LPS export ABC transporter protein LptC
MRWQQWARIGLVVVAVAVVIAVGLTLGRRRAPPPPPPPVVRTDPKAVVESTTGRVVRFNRAHEDIRVEYERQLTYADGTTKLFKVRVVEEDRGDGRSFTLTGDEGSVGKDEAAVSLDGHIALVEGDGFTAETGAATYNDTDNMVRAPGAIAFHHDRLSGSGQGMLYDKNTDVLTILDQATVRMAPDAGGKGAADITAGRATFLRMDHIVQFDGNVHVTRGGQDIGAGSAIVYLSDDDKHITVLELHDHAVVKGAQGAAGSLQGITGSAVNIEYADDGQAIERAIISGDAAVRLSGGAGKAGREISAAAIDVTFAPDGETPTGLMARGNVRLTLPADEGVAARTVRAGTFTASADPEAPERGLTTAHFETNVEYREKSASVDRVARSARLDVGLKEGMSAFDSAVFAGGARFDDAKVSGTAASVAYVADKGTLALSGREAGSPAPHVFNDRIAVDATAVDVTLAGPVLAAKGNVKSVLQPPKKSAKGAGARLPGMLKQDEAVTVTADSLTFDGDADKASYDGRAQLWQGETSIKAASIDIDSKSGDLGAKGSVLTTTMLDQTDQDKKKTRVRSTATADRFAYDDKGHKASYTGHVHFSQAENDLTADRVDLFLTESGDEIQRAEAADPDNGLVLREQGRKTVGTKLTYSAADGRYDISGAPVTITDECGRVTNGRRLMFRKSTDTIEIDGNRRVRTQTRNGSKCQ